MQKDLVVCSITPVSITLVVELANVCYITAIL